jgi:hypothetical protein
MKTFNKLWIVLGLGFWGFGLKLHKGYGTDEGGTAPPPAETFYLTDDAGNILTDDSGNPLTWSTE